MKIFALIAAFLATSLPSFANMFYTTSPDIYCPRISATTAIIWEAPTNDLPKTLWTYRRVGSQPFSATAISNAMAIASLQGEHPPKPSTNLFFIWEDNDRNNPGPVPCVFSIIPYYASINYWMPHYSESSGNDFPRDEAMVELARKCAWQLGLDPAQLIQRGTFARTCCANQKGIETSTNVCGRGVFFARRLDGVSFFSDNNAGEGSEGLSVEFGGHGQLRSFSLIWMDLARHESHQTASPEQIISLIRTGKMLVVPNADEEDYLARIKALTGAGKISITKITPRYIDWEEWEKWKDNEPPQFVNPVAELEAVAKLENTNVTFRFLAPLIEMDAVEKTVSDATPSATGRN